MEAEAKQEPKVIVERSQFKGKEMLKISMQYTPTFSRTLFNGGEVKAKTIVSNPEFRKFAGLE